MDLISNFLPESADLSTWDGDKVSQLRRGGRKIKRQSSKSKRKTLDKGMKSEIVET